MLKLLGCLAVPCLVLIASIGVLEAADTPACAKCHAQEASLEQHSIHVQEGITCADCHGGNIDAKDKATAHGSGFRGKPSKESIPQLCASCHSDVKKMNPYGTPTDQYAQYLTSHHGEKLAQGNLDVATCADCHGNHGIREGRDPKSPVYPKNVPATCSKCHSNAKLIEKHGLAGDEEEQYMQSIHADLLFKKEDLSAPTCSTCHGNHGAAPPGFTEISNVCGKCHIKQQEFYLESPHAAFAQEIGFQSCVTCHGNHKVLRTRDEIATRCMDCHSENDEAMKKREAIFTTIRDTEGRFHQTEKKLGELTRAGYSTEDEELLLQEAKTYMLQLPPVQHKLQPEEVQKISASATEVLRTIDEHLEKKQKLERMKTFALLPVWLFLISMALVFWKKSKQLEEQGGGDTHNE